MRLWGEYLRENGHALTLISFPTYHKLIRVGLPNRLRGEIWELSSGAMYLRWANRGLYQNLLERNKDAESLALEEIEKDLNRYRLTPKLLIIDPYPNIQRTKRKRGSTRYAVFW
jgi:TBC1 domain family member 8/9